MDGSRDSLVTRTPFEVFFVEAYHADELNESQAEGDLHLLGHVLYGADELVVAPEEVPHQPLLVPGPGA